MPFRSPGRRRGRRTQSTRTSRALFGPSSMSLERDWPLFGLWIQTPRLTLRYPTEADLGTLNALANQGIHDPSVMPFDTPWTDEPPEIRPRPCLRFHRGSRPN